ncbi:MAG: discoidin domain-containing protein, partial [Micrococcales bacterium]|nr:discoidin domain-containing protein [Micrococcales bacterium]
MKLSKITTTRRALTLPVAGALALSLAGIATPAFSQTADDPPGYRNIALNRAAMATAYGTNFNNTASLITDGLYTDPAAIPAPRPIATASTGTGTTGPAVAFDYIINNTTWTSTGTLNATNPQWLAIDLLAAKGLRSYRVQPVCGTSGSGLIANYPTAWQFQGSADGSAWTTLDTQSGLTAPGGANPLPCPGRTFTVPAGTNFQHYRINVTAASAATVRISQLFLYGNDGYPLVPYPEFASYWQSTTAATDRYLTVDLGAPSDFDVVKLLWLSATTTMATDYTIATSDDGETWANAATVTGATGWSHTIVFSTP